VPVRVEIAVPDISTAPFFESLGSTPEEPKLRCSLDAG
jgi:hypothetical protein